MKVIGCCCIQRCTFKSAELRKETSPKSTEGVDELKFTPLWCFYALHGNIWRKVNFHNNVWCILALKPKKKEIDLAEETEVIVLSNHWYKRQMIYCCCGSIMRKAKPRTVSTCRRATFSAAVIWSSPLLSFVCYRDYTEQTSVSVIFLHNVGMLELLSLGTLLNYLLAFWWHHFAAAVCKFSLLLLIFSNHFCNYTPAVIRTVQCVDIIRYILLTLEPVCEHVVREKEKKRKGKKEWCHNRSWSHQDVHNYN